MLPGDITNFLLTGSYSAADQNSEEGRPYLRAQAEGQVRPRVSADLIINHVLPASSPGTAPATTQSARSHSSNTSDDISLYAIS